ncbi:hypothetical protein ACN9MI_19945 [Rhodococcoides fascians]|jgi:hypothetical protein|uniref:hypothetical protein n=1 Tax=Rhodococcoides fascians TaxID=1828 RepID=UPI003CF3288A
MNHPADDAIVHWTVLIAKAAALQNISTTAPKHAAEHDRGAPMNFAQGEPS